MGSRAERRARREAKLAEYKEAFRNGLVKDEDDWPELSGDKLKRAIADSLEATYIRLIKKHPPQEKGLIREAMTSYVNGLGRGEI
jgi:hypothetical protein